MLHNNFWTSLHLHYRNSEWRLSWYLPAGVKRLSRRWDVQEKSFDIRGTSNESGDSRQVYFCFEVLIRFDNSDNRPVFLSYSIGRQDSRHGRPSAVFSNSRRLDFLFRCFQTSCRGGVGVVWLACKSARRIHSNYLNATKLLLKTCFILSDHVIVLWPRLRFANLLTDTVLTIYDTRLYSRKDKWYSDASNMIVK